MTKSCIHMKVKIKKLFPDVTIPEYAHPGDAGFDVFSREDVIVNPNERHIFKLGFAAELPEQTVALVWDKGGVASLHGVHSLAGVIDASYRGEWVVTLHNLGHEAYEVKQGQKIAQVLIQTVERVDFEETKVLSETPRGEGKFGSTGV